MAGLIEDPTGTMPPAGGEGLVAGAMAPDWAMKLKEFQSSDWKPTPLAPEEAASFKGWLYNTKLFNNIKGIVAKENDIPLDKISNDRVAEMMMQQGDYDYVGAWKSGMGETISPHDGMPHWGSRTDDGKWLKSPAHETAWKELFMEQHGTDPDDLGLHSIDAAIAWSRKQK